MSIGSAVLGFGVLSQQNGLYFSVPYICSGLYFGQEQHLVLDLINKQSQRDCSLAWGRHGEAYFSDSSGVYLTLEFSGRHLSGIIFSGISNQIPSELRYFAGKNAYMSDFIVDDHMLWIKSDSEIKVKKVSNVNGRRISSKDFNVSVKRGVTRTEIERISSLSKPLQNKRGSNFSHELYDIANKDKLESLRSTESSLRQRIKNITYELQQIDKELGYHESLMSDIDSSYKGLSDKYKELVDSLEGRCKKYGDFSLGYLLRNGYLHKEETGALILVPSARKPDEKILVTKTKVVRCLGADKCGKWYGIGGTKYHDEFVDYKDYEIKTDAAFFQAKTFVYACEGLFDDIRKLYRSIDSLRVRRETALVNKQQFDSINKGTLVSRRDKLYSELHELNHQLDSCRKSLYAG